MQRGLVTLLAAVLVVGAMFAFSGCSSEPPVEEPIAGSDMSEDATALTGEDLPLPDVDDTIYVEPIASAFEDIHFDYDRYEIRGRDEGTLQIIAAWLEDNERVTVLIEGHCDERGTNEYNMALGEQRALAARRYLVGLGVASDRMTTISYGEERPQDRRSTEDAWAANRRAHFSISE
ncbi:MAG: peptidoglycan-associated lipoprotein Pal [Candidatus Eisenbacteria bacterium]